MNELKKVMLFYRCFYACSSMTACGQKEDTQQKDTAQTEIPLKGSRKMTRERRSRALPWNLKKRSRQTRISLRECRI